MENTKCPDVEPLLDGYFDGELSAGELDLAQSHLSQCADCQTKLAEIEGVSKKLAQLPRLSLSKDIAQEVLSKAARKKGKVLIFQRKELWAAVAVAVVLTLTWQVLQQPNEQPVKLPMQASDPGKPTEKLAIMPIVAEPVVNKAVAKQTRVTHTNKTKAEPVISPAIKPKVLIAGSNHDDVLAFDYGYQPSLMEGMGLATDEDGLYALKM